MGVGLLLKRLGILYLLSEQRQELRHLSQVLNILGLGLSLSVYIVLGGFLLGLSPLIPHECIEFLQVNLASCEVQLLVQVRIHFSYLKYLIS